MKSSKDIFIEMREREAFEEMNQVKQGKDVPSYKKYLDRNVEIEMMREHEEQDHFANQIFMEENGL